MSEIPTPRTDAIVEAVGTWDSLDFTKIAEVSRQLERELREVQSALSVREDENDGLSGQLAEARAQVATLREHIEKLYKAAANGLGYVGSANYRERQVEAHEWLNTAYEAALASTPETKHPDTERLDWLNGEADTYQQAEPIGWIWCLTSDNDEPDIRAAIDAARKANP